MPLVGARDVSRGPNCPGEAQTLGRQEGLPLLILTPEPDTVSRLPLKAPQVLYYDD